MRDEPCRSGDEEAAFGHDVNACQSPWHSSPEIVGLKAATPAPTRRTRTSSSSSSEDKCYKRCRSDSYENATPWIKELAFAHSYYASSHGFLLMLLGTYKSYALVYPDRLLQALEMSLAVLVPFLHNMRFYVGSWGFETGDCASLCLFLLLSSALLCIFMYFSIFQAYILPLEYPIHAIAVYLVAAEAMCGAANMFLAVRTLNLTCTQRLCIVVSTLTLLLTYSLVCLPVVRLVIILSGYDPRDSALTL